MISFNTNILVYATLSAPLAKTDRAGDLLVRGMRTGSSILVLANASGVQQRGNSQGRNRGRRGPNGA